MDDSATTGFLLRGMAHEIVIPLPCSPLTALFVLATNLTIYKEKSGSGEKCPLKTPLLPRLRHRLLNDRNLRLKI